ncbi:CHAD domain-containing protein [Nocardia sp. alder85J]|uniref:CHAD domain-containing protein n=1 Tax=Nocardia sp. alder85J TaxID=2862949 RepID=UPI001CD63634|nr:CHAD domain-containing protein [Nocardia sp. alder85J]MCX4098641.1 CHAD domain-containing protein [Nocardia sp. alder85J]
MNTSAGPALAAALDDDVDSLLTTEPEVRADAPDSVHQMRVATRRLRSVLRSYRTVLRQHRVDEMRGELQWLAGLLGVARDAEVRAERFETLLAEQPPEQRAAAERLVSDERAKYAAAHREVLDALDGDRYSALHDRLVRWHDHPPLGRRHAKAEAARVFSGVLRDDFHRLQRLAHTGSKLTGDERIEHLHEIRKGAKRLRYSAEAAARILDGPAVELADRAKKLQTVLGDHRDAVEAQAAIRSRAVMAAARGADTSGYDELAQVEADAARKALEEYPAAAAFLRHKYGSRSLRKGKSKRRKKK